MGQVIGFVLAELLVVPGVVGIQESVWGNNAPNWFLVIIIPVSFILGAAGTYLGDKWWS